MAQDNAGSMQTSLLTKYAYYALQQNKERYPKGFPIYDSLVRNVYGTVCRMLEINVDSIKMHSNSSLPIEEYVRCLDKVRSKLFGEGLFCGFQQYDVLDAYLWRMGKFDEGNLSLLLTLEDYKEMIGKLKLGIIEKGETIATYSSRMADEFRGNPDAYRLLVKAKKHKKKNGEDKISYFFDINKAIAMKMRNDENEPFESNEYIKKTPPSLARHLL